MNVDNANEITPLVFLIDCKYCNKKQSQVNYQKIENSENMIFCMEFLQSRSVTVDTALA